MDQHLREIKINRTRERFHKMFTPLTLILLCDSHLKKKNNVTGDEPLYGSALSLVEEGKKNVRSGGGKKKKRTE